MTQKADEWTNRPSDKFDYNQACLALSLVCYVSPDDRELSRRRFLNTVISRIEDDLQDDTT